MLRFERENRWLGRKRKTAEEKTGGGEEEATRLLSAAQGSSGSIQRTQITRLRLEKKRSILFHPSAQHSRIFRNSEQLRDPP
jgi:hypothetical protein